MRSRLWEECSGLERRTEFLTRYSDMTDKKKSDTSTTHSDGHIFKENKLRE